MIAQVNICKKCRLWKSARHAVTGEGNIDASLFLIGEAPGNNEDLQGRPFVGQAGKLLDKLLSDICLDRSEVYISNIVKHRPPKNRPPKQDEIKACAPYLKRQIRTIKPRIIVTLGMHSTKYILSETGVNVSSMNSARGIVHEVELFGLRVKIIPTFHPAAILYNREYLPQIKQDFRRIGKETQKRLPKV